MKNKLKLLFAYFRGFKTELVTTHILFGDDDIEDWTMEFSISPTKSIEPSKNVLKIIEEFIWDNFRTMHENVDLSMDNIWSLSIYIKPFENKMTFQTESKHKVVQKIEETEDLSEFSQSTVEKIHEIQKNENISIIDIQFYGAWGDGDITKLEYNGKQIKDYWIKDKFWEITYDIVEKHTNKFWYEDEGVDGEIRIWGEDVIVWLNKISSEWENDNLNLVITLEDYE
jgi:hypothetical protein